MPGKNNPRKTRIIIAAAGTLALTAVFFVLARRQSVQRRDTPTLQTGYLENKSGMVAVDDGTKTHSSPAQKLQKYSKETIGKLSVLDEIFKSKNDNDERLDTVLRRLSVEDKNALMEKYAALPMEARNERGTIVFLLGRNISRLSDFDFFEHVLDEKTCMSLGDCNVSDRQEGPVGLESGLDVTLNYPQLVVLQTAARYLEDHKNPPEYLAGEMLDRIRKIAASARGSGIPVLMEKGLSIEKMID